MRTFLLTIFWVSTVGSVIQLMIIASAGWFIFSGGYTFFELNVDVFVSQIVPWMVWLKTFIVALFGEFGRWILTIPILIISPVKFVFGTIIGLWAYSVAKQMPMEPAYT